jgi:hypothetical protein
MTAGRGANSNAAVTARDWARIRRLPKLLGAGEALRCNGACLTQAAAKSNEKPELHPPIGKEPRIGNKGRMTSDFTR